MTIFSKNLRGAWPLGPPWLRLCPTGRNSIQTHLGNYRKKTFKDIKQ